MSNWKTCLASLAAVVAVPILAANPVIVNTGFDSAEFNSGNLNNQNGWSVVQGTATVQGSVVEGGDQAVSLAANTIVDRSASDSGTVVWTETHFRGAGTDQTPSYPSSPAASAIVHFSSGGSIQGGLNGPGIFVADGDGTGAINWTATSVSTLNANSWYKITIRQDYTAKTWDCYIDDNLVASDLGFRDDSVAQLNGFRQYSGVQSYMDTFLIRTPSTSDVNYDGSVNAQDVVLKVEQQGATLGELGPIIFSDFDSNADGQITAADVAAVVDVILGN